MGIQGSAECKGLYAVRGIGELIDGAVVIISGALPGGRAQQGKSVRGYLKGLWSPVQSTPLNHNDTYSGTGNLTGKSFLSQSIMIGSNSAWQNSFIGQVHIETSSTWS